MYLQKLGLEELADTVIQTENGPVEARDFLDICGDDARPHLETFAALDQNDPRYAPIKQALRSIVMGYMSQDSDS